ncbi:hypothetical protein GGX14DRAFT_413709 [Mycena pura]|uniref:CID domain-containing protein n=1 Tax=Mycena pura TaxID=153505 RepID=A0AAD6YSX9_9AGAR|nr:hypothetical protein GGX14DRAFT_413709 [Mycena pura]
MYSQQQYGVQPFPHQQAPYFHQQPPYYQQPPPPPPPVAVYQPDPVSFRRDYTNHLAELKVNSRPIIQNLSMIAQEFSRFADIVAQCIESHIRRVPQWMKLPAFYLLDAISKNVYEPYARHFSAFVVPLFLETYGQVDEQTRSKMEEMLLTWRTGSPTSTFLFGPGSQNAIERGVWGDGASASNSNLISTAQVLTELEFTLSQKERAFQTNPYDTTSQNHIIVLHQLRKLVEAGVSQDELQQILTQLRSLARAAATTVVQPPVPVTTPVPATPASWSAPAQPSYPVQPSFPPSASPMYPTYDTVKAEPPTTVLPSVAPSASGSSIDLVGLLSTLKKRGYVPENGTPLGAGTSSLEDVSKPESPPDLERESSRSYRDAILLHDVRLTTMDITRNRPGIVEFLYDRLAAQCKQCGIRFPDTTFGKKHMEGHLDMHFQQNRKANQNVGRGHSRSWFVGLEDWVHDLAVDVKGKGREGARPLNAKAAAAAANAQRDADLRAQYVVVPRGEEAKPVACPICKEPFKSEFLEDDEEWVWRNAVLKDERVYHATCHAEAAQSGLALRLRSDLAASLRSHSSTPEIRPVGSGAVAAPQVLTGLKSSDASLRASLSPSPESKLTGTKRKVEDTDRTVSDEAEGTPRAKKLALAQADQSPQ